MVKLKALRPLSGNYGTVGEGQHFEAEDAAAESLEARGLAVRIHVPIVQRIAKAFSGAPENKTVVIVAPQRSTEPPRVTEYTARRRNRR